MKNQYLLLPKNQLFFCVYYLLNKNKYLFLLKNQPFFHKKNLVLEKEEIFIPV
jgi:hypothetical protein